MMKKMLSLGIALTLLCTCLPAAAASAPQGETMTRQEEIAFLCDKLEEIHPDLYGRCGKEAFDRRRQEIAAGAEKMSELGFAFELQTLIALAGDSHTTSGISGNVQGITQLPVAAKWFSDRWVLSTVPAEHAQYLGWEVVSIGGRTMQEALGMLTPFISHDNEVKLRRQFGQIFNLAPLLRHFGVVGDEEEIALGLRKGKQQAQLSLRPADAQTIQTISFERLASRRAAVPATEKRDKNYLLKTPDSDTLYIQYNLCQEDEDLPIEAFTAQVSEKLAGRARAVVDLRYNGGGSDGVFIPVIERLSRFVKSGGKLYSLIGEATYSSAIINAAMLKEAGAVLVGEPTSGNVDHFGATGSFEMPNAPLKVRCSTKWISLGGLLPSAKKYGSAPLTPDIPAPQTLEDYLAGVDSAYRAVPA